MKTSALRLCALAAVLAAAVFQGSAMAQIEDIGLQRKYYLTLSGGGVRQIGRDYDRYEWGYSIGAQILGVVNENWLLGGRIAYNRWDTNDGEVKKLRSDLTDQTVSGDIWTVEIMPLARLATNTAEPYGLFLQGGLGLVILDNRVTLRGLDAGGNVVTESTGDKDQARFGAQIGVGGSLDFDNFRIEAYPLYNYVWTDKGRDVQYTSYNLGIGFSF
jgi:hypothetical protein